MTEPTLLLVETPVHGRVLHLGRDRERLIAGFHGYGESAEIHLAELETLAPDGWSIASVQALHPFYTRDQRVVASWMTKVDREEAIADNIEYVRRAVAVLPPSRVLVFAGFSQGAAMAWRAAAAIRCDGVLAIGGDLPPDVDPPAVPALLCRGSRDDWYTAEKLDHDLSRLPAADAYIYDGGHEFTEDLRARARTWLTGKG